MLYDIVPPAIFFLSLGGIMVVLGRVIVRVRKAAFTTRVTDAGAHAVTEPSELLRPSGRGIRAITSRTALAAQWFRHMFTSLAHLPTTLRTWFARRRAASPAPPPASPSSAREVVAPPPPRRERWQALAQNALRAPASRLTSRLASRRTAASPAAETPEPAVNLTRLFSEKKESADEAPAPAPPRRSRFRLRRLQTEEAAPAAPAPVATPSPVTARSRLRRAKSAAPTPLAQAQQAIAEHKYTYAESILVEYIVKHTKDTKAYILLGQAAIGRQAWEEAMEIFEQVLQWGSTKPAIYANLGHAAYRAGRYSKALQILQRAHEADPTNQDILEDLLGIARKMDNRGLQHSIETKLEELAAPQPSA